MFSDRGHGPRLVTLALPLVWQDAPDTGRADQNAELKPVQPMSRQKQRQCNDFSDAEFLGFAKSYLSEAFPNAQRIDCPPDFELQSMAEHPVEGRDAAASEYLACCSPCFNRYMEILANL